MIMLFARLESSHVNTNILEHNSSDGSGSRSDALHEFIRCSPIVHEAWGFFFHAVYDVHFRHLASAANPDMLIM